MFDDDGHVNRWSGRELATLGALAEAFVPGPDGAERATLAADVLDAALDPTQVRQLRLVLRAMDLRLVNLVLGGGARPLRAMPPERREAYLLRWVDSGIPLRRSAIGAFRRLLAFLAYAAPPGAADRLAAMGYEQDRPPITDDPTPIRAYALPEPGPSASDELLRLDADVVVIGSGAGGGVVAAALARAGRDVVVLESGPLVSEPDLPRDELTAFDRLYLGHGLSSTWDGSKTLLAGAAVGGGTLVNWMSSLPAPRRVRDEWAREHGLDGLDGSEWDADVAAVLHEVGAAHTETIGPKDEAIRRGALALGWRVAAMPRNGSCDACGSCGFGCIAGTKQSGLRVHLAEAYRAGARIVPDAEARRVLLEGHRAVGVEALVAAPGSAGDGSTRRRFVVRARQVVVAAGALRTPAVLLRSGLRHPALGRNLRIHPVPVVVGVHAQPIDMWRGPMQAIRVTEFEEDVAGRNGYVVEAAPGHPGLIALALPWDGAASHAALMRDARRLGPLIAVTRDGGGGRVRLTGTGGVRVDYDLDTTGIATLRHALVAMARLARAGGAREVIAAAARPVRADAATLGDERAFQAYLARLASMDFAPDRGTVVSAHQMGTARAGCDPRRHACDPRGRVRRSDDGDAVVSGLYVTDGSLFPTALGVNPVITIMALARRVSRTVLAEA